MTVKIIENDKGNPPGKLADVELHFEACGSCVTGGIYSDDDCRCSPLAGLKLVGFAIWERRGGSGRNITLPARQYSVNGERRSFALLRPHLTTLSTEDATANVRMLILNAYDRYVAETAQEQS